MINRVSFRNFKCLRDVSVDLERFTVFVGPNASGKSSTLQALNRLCHAFNPNLGKMLSRGVAFYDPSASERSDSAISQAVSRGSSEPVELSVAIGQNGYRYRTGSSTGSTSRPSAQSNWDGSGLGEATDNEPTQWRRWAGGDSPLPSSVLLQLESSKLVDPSAVPHDPSAMGPDGSGMHSALASMTLNDPDSWQELQENLKLIIPTIRRLRHTKSAQVNQPTAVLFDTVGGESIPAAQVSEGTLLVLGLLTAFHSPSRPNLMLLDDLDRGLHPKAQRELIALLRSLLDNNPDLQILATTHSPYMLDCMDVNEVRMTFLKEDGSTVCAALTSHPNFPRWKDEMTPGEMWSLFGEKWIAEEVAA